ncbi:MAG TPA: integrase arm-type DNA-binding domain-containing protein [Rhodocyclaceae bacterium]|jgi:integrase
MATKAGKHPEKALTAVKVKALAAPGRYADGNGLYLVVDPSGSKRWVLRTVIKGKRCDIGLGGLSLVSLAEARDEAARLRKIARNNGDPLMERRTARKVIPTFEEAARQVHKEHSPSWRNPKHAGQWINTMAEYAFPEFGSRRVDAIGTSDVKAALLSIWHTKPETARRVRQRINMVFDWCKASGLRTGDNPCDGLAKVLPKQTDRGEHHAAMPYPDVPDFILTLRESDAGELARLAFEFLILTAGRTGEIVAARRSEINANAGIWTIPAERMKAKREHRVPLSQRCLEILNRAKELAGDSEYVFPGRSPGKPLSNMAFLMMLRRMSLDITAHGFRSSFRDWAAERTNVPRDVCEAALAHSVQDKTEAAYNRTDLFEKRRNLMDAWAGFCAGATKAN